MFKLIKIRGARTNVPEITVLPIDGETAYTAGCLYFIGEDYLANGPYAEDDIRFIPIETVAKDSGKSKIHGYIVNEDMVFETDIYNDYTQMGIGDTLCAHLNSNGDMDAADAAAGDEIKLLSKESTATDGKVLVALKW